MLNKRHISAGVGNRFCRLYGFVCKPAVTHNILWKMSFGNLFMATDFKICLGFINISNLPLRQKRYLRTCAPSEDSDFLCIRAVLSGSSLDNFWIAKDAKFLHADYEDSDQTARMRRLI